MSSSSLQVIILDTETNGLPTNRYAPISTPGAYPAIIQMSWGVYTVTGRTLTPLRKHNACPALHTSIPWDAGAERIHQIPEAEARAGTPPAEAFTELATELAAADVIIAHNLAFDKPVIRAAAYAESERIKGDPATATSLRNIWPLGKQEFCSMREMTDILGLPSSTPGRAKPPRLAELYEALYGHPYTLLGTTLHNSRNDTDCLEKCIYMMLRRGIVSVTGGRFSVRSKTE
jgi:DNA polymerase-3 subunit alpha